MSDIRKALSYCDVLMSPRYSDCEHLTDANIDMQYYRIPSTFMAKPIINAPMNNVCSIDLLNTLNNKYNCPITIHRWFNTVEEQIKFYESCCFKNFNQVFISVGIANKWQEWIDKLNDYRRNKNKKFGILVDVANCDTKTGVDTVKYIRKNFEDTTNIMAGNIATRSGFSRLQDVGANFIRVGLGGSSICSTRLKTGFGIPTLTSIVDCSKIKDTAYLVADGGIEHSGDICKAIAAGADMVMIGKLLASTDQSSAEKFDKDKNFTDDEKEYAYVKYFGMASKENKINTNNKSIKSIEGVSGLIPYTGKTIDVMNDIIGNLHSSMAYYGGCRNWEEFKRKIKFVEITSQGWNESMTRLI